MNYFSVLQGVENAKRFLKPHIQIDSISTDNDNRVVSWRGRKPGVFKNIFYPIEYQHLIDHQQYSVLMSDGSFFQFFYEFNGDFLSRARLGYYPRPLGTRDSSDDLLDAAENAMDRSDEDLYEHLFNWLDLLELENKLPSNTSHIRFDFDSEVTSHCKSHIQFSGMQELRVPSICFPMPMAFVQLCIPIFADGMFSNVGDLDLAFESRNAFQIQRPSELLILSS